MFTKAILGVLFMIIPNAETNVEAWVPQTIVEYNTIEECMHDAYEVNHNNELPYVLVCAPNLKAAV